MKTRTIKNEILTMVMALFSLAAFAQSMNDQILSGVQNPTDYETIELAQMDPNLSTFMNLVGLSGLGVSWKLSEDKHTVLIPTNEAFKEMTVERYLHLTNPENRKDLIKFVRYHFLPQEYTERDFKNNDVINTEGSKIEIVGSSTFDNVYLGGGKVIKTVDASDGIVHVVNGVVEPTGNY